MQSIGKITWNLYNIIINAKHWENHMKFVKLPVLWSHFNPLVFWYFVCCITFWNSLCSVFQFSFSLNSIFLLLGQCLAREHLDELGSAPKNPVNWVLESLVLISFYSPIGFLGLHIHLQFSIHLIGTTITLNTFSILYIGLKRSKCRICYLWQRLTCKGNQ